MTRKLRLSLAARSKALDEPEPAWTSERLNALTGPQRPPLQTSTEPVVPPRDQPKRVMGRSHRRACE
jgi:hypothetical protein